MSKPQQPLSPFLSPLQEETARRIGRQDVPANCLVTGGTGFVGQRLVEMLVERGAKRVVSFDIVPKPTKAWDHPAIEYVVGDICDAEAVANACKGMDCVFHLAAAVGPFHPKELYTRVNYEGSLNVLAGCRQHKVPKLVLSSSPSTRFDGKDVDGLREDQMPQLPLQKYMQDYAETKAMAEMAVLKACSDDLLTIAVAPHQVFGPRDNLFLPNVLEAAGTGLLRIFSTPRTGNGYNRICFTHVDNYCHGLILGAAKLYKNSPALAKFYVVTDGNTHPFPEGYAHMWKAIDEAGTAMGFASIWDKYKLPVWLLMPLAHVCDAVGYVSGKKLKLNPFNVRVMTMHRWFDISNAVRDLDYEPIIPFSKGWADTIQWFKENWLPTFYTSGRGAGLAQQSEAKINIQAAGTKRD